MKIYILAGTVTGDLYDDILVDNVMIGDWFFTDLIDAIEFAMQWFASCADSSCSRYVCINIYELSELQMGHRRRVGFVGKADDDVIKCYGTYWEPHYPIDMPVCAIYSEETDEIAYQQDIIEKMKGE